VELADSRGFGVGVRLVGSNTQTTFLARGRGPGQPLELQGDVDPNLGVTDGDALVTSGLDQSLYPPDVLVGRVIGTGRAPDGSGAPPVTAPGGQPVPLRGVEVELFVDLRALSYVTVLLWRPGG
jgi:hypothetical protein